MDYESLDKSDDREIRAHHDNERSTCSECGRPVPSAKRNRSMTTTHRQPTEEETWKNFWTKLATIWLAMPPEAQQQCIDTDGDTARGVT